MSLLYYSEVGNWRSPDRPSKTRKTAGVVLQLIKHDTWNSNRDSTMVFRCSLFLKRLEVESAGSEPVWGDASDDSTRPPNSFVMQTVVRCGKSDCVLYSTSSSRFFFFDFLLSLFQHITTKIYIDN